MTRRQLLETDGGGTPDFGLAQIAAGFTAQARAAVGAPQADTPADSGPRAGAVSPDDVWLLALPPQQNTAAGTLDPVDWGPPPGWVWRITYVPFLFGSGTTNVAFYLNSALAFPLFEFTASATWEPGHLYLQNGERLVAVTTGGGASILVRGERIATHFLPTYLA